VSGHRTIIPRSRYAERARPRDRSKRPFRDTWSVAALAECRATVSPVPLNASRVRPPRQRLSFYAISGECELNGSAVGLGDTGENSPWHSRSSACPHRVSTWMRHRSMINLRTGDLSTAGAAVREMKDHGVREHAGLECPNALLDVHRIRCGGVKLTRR
jgi:hypothetical protein